MYFFKVPWYVNNCSFAIAQRAGLTFPFFASRILDKKTIKNINYDNKITCPLTVSTAKITKGGVWLAVC